MPVQVDESTAEFIREPRVARVAPGDADRQPAVIPICYVFDDEAIYTPIDEKPKTVEAGSLRRIRNIEANQLVALVIDDYSDDWNKLVYVLISGNARIIQPSNEASEHARAVQLLREKYPQYRSMRIDERPIIKITPVRIKRWDAADRKG